MDAYSLLTRGVRRAAVQCLRPHPAQGRHLQPSLGGAQSLGLFSPHRTTRQTAAWCWLLRSSSSWRAGTQKQPGSGRASYAPSPARGPGAGLGLRAPVTFLPETFRGSLLPFVCSKQCTLGHQAFGPPVLPQQHPPPPCPDPALLGLVPHLSSIWQMLGHHLFVKPSVTLHAQCACTALPRQGRPPPPRGPGTSPGGLWSPADRVTWTRLAFCFDENTVTEKSCTEGALLRR